MANPAIVKQSLTLPDFTELGARKLADLLEKGFVITGVCFERQVEGTQPQRGFVDFAGFVGWWRPEMQPSNPLTPAQVSGLAESAGYWSGDSGKADFINGIRYAESAHGVADMKGGQDVER
ncbi:hypothetical protein [Acidovorax sp. Leaf73]|uniref:hypothetical protein n=1 Tax=Acidovorax sp. Leaf73 TaxID=2876566 RepID=UPI001E657379|nr:hypothetical protein [Acidovorax sp. Leaf73]